MVEKVMFNNVRKKLEELVDLYDEMYGVWYGKCRREVEGGSRTVEWYSSMIDNLHKKIGEMLVLMERVVKLEKEVSKMNPVDEGIKALTYSILSLDEEDRKEVIDFVKGKLERRGVERRLV